VTILQPGGFWVIENAVMGTTDEVAALATCHMRGWVEVITNGVPSSEIGSDGKILHSLGMQPVYRLTEAGWNTINQSHAWEVFACAVAVVSLVVSAVSLVVSLVALQK
jgi:hypothetical protein